MSSASEPDEEMSTEIPNVEQKALQEKLTGVKSKQLQLRQLHEIEKECREKFAESDELISLISALKKSRNLSKRQPLADSLSPNVCASYTVKQWKNILDSCLDELPKSDELVKRAKEGLKKRQKTHKLPLAAAIDDADRLSLRKLDILEKKCLCELGEGDSLLKSIQKCKGKREKSHKEPMVAEYTKMMNSKSLSQISVVKYSKFLKIVEKELPADDSFVSQVKAAQKAIVEEKSNPQKSTGKAISRRSRAKKSKNSKAMYDLEVGKLLKDGKANREPNPLLSLFYSIKEDLSGIHDSNMNKLIIVAIFTVYIVLMFYTLQLAHNISPITWEALFSNEAPNIATDVNAAVESAVAENVAAQSGLD